MGLREDIISTVKYAQMEEAARSELLNLLKITSFDFRRTDKFSGKDWNKFREYIVARIIPEKMADLMKYKSILDTLCGDIYIENEHYNYMGLEIKPGRPEDIPEDASQEILFDGIESRIIEEIRNAKYVIWVAMAWFTNEKIYKELVKKKQEGLSITLVLDNNDRNHNSGLDYSVFETYELKIPSNYTNYMHDKFCIIDFRTVIHGTFNWTKAANFNKETSEVETGKRDKVDSFADEFIRLKKAAINQLVVSAF